METRGDFFRNQLATMKLRLNSASSVSLREEILDK